MFRPTAQSLNRFGILLVGVLLISFVLRGPLVAVGSLVKPLSEDTGLSAAAVGSLTGLPVVLFGVAAPLAPLTVRRAGAHLAVTLFLAGAAIGAFMRSLDSEFALFAGSVLIGLSICVGNVVVPVLIRMHATPARAALLMGINTAAANVGSMIGASLSAPLADVAGWRASLSLWGWAALAIGCVWVLLAGGASALHARPEGGVRADEVGIRPLEGELARPAARRPVWLAPLLTLALVGHAFSYYGLTSWLPSYLQDSLTVEPAAAGGIASIFQIMGIAGGLITPLLLQRLGSLFTGLIVGALWLALPTGMLVDPSLWALWCGLGGYAQGAGFVVIFTLLIRSSASPAHTAHMSAVVQTFGYAAAASAPTVVGVAHESTGGWVLPLEILIASTGVFTLAVLAAGSLSRPSAYPR